MNEITRDDITPTRDQQNYVADHSQHGDINEYLAGIYGDKFRAYRETWRKAQNFEIETDFPLYLSLETLLQCNFKCGMCPFSVPEELEKIHYSEEMSDELFDKVIGEASEHGCPSMGFNTMNEPLLDQKIIERIEKATKAGIFDSRMNTNASLLTEKRAERLVDSGLTRLLVGVDAATEETYKKVRIGGNFQKLMRNVDRFLEFRAKKNQKLPILRVSFVRMNINEHEVEEFINQWLGKADLIAVQEYRPPSHDVELKEDRHAKSTQIVEDYSCTQPFERFVIKGNGNVHPCCSFHSYKLYMGNAKENTIHSIWNSEEMKTLRRHMRDHTWNQIPVCNTCLKDLTYAE